jgi:hypothetical protein
MLLARLCYGAGSSEQKNGDVIRLSGGLKALVDLVAQSTDPDLTIAALTALRIIQEDSTAAPFFFFFLYRSDCRLPLILPPQMRRIRGLS